MSKSFVYTDSFYATDSSVISSVFYNADTRHLIVILNNGVQAGYENVDQGVFDNFEKEQRFGGSLGRFWNNMVKGNLDGWDTEGIDIYLTVGESTRDVFASYEIANVAEHLVVVESDDAGTFHDEAASQDVEIEAAEPEDAPEIDEVYPFRYEATSEPEVVDVKAVFDIGQRRYDITVERTVVREETKVIYANNEDQALELFNDKFGTNPADESIRLVSVSRRL